MTPAAADMTSLALRDHIAEILIFVTRDIESTQTAPEQIKKPQGEKLNGLRHSPAELHAALRLAGGFNIDQVVSEYRALRASIIRLWNAEGNGPACQDIMDLTSFNESIDQALMESISYYMKKVNHSKNLFLGILSHDLRTPLSAALMSAQLMPQIGALNERQAMLGLQIVESISRASQIVANLFDLTRARFGSGIPVLRDHMDMGFVSRQLVEEMRTVYPDRMIVLEISGELKGEWDKARVGQVFSNLIGNAVQHGFKETPVSVCVKGTPTEVALSVHNEGVPIPGAMIGKIFDSLTRGREGDDARPAEEGHLGLGLYITKEIIASHGGTICVASSEKHGTTFTARLPRACSMQ
ncbi:MAG: HAMP domain-containing sensor histidine kinase [Alphaproteobacteria bacterium]